MGLLDKFKKKSKPPEFYLDPRLAEKIEKSDLWEFSEKQRDVLGRRTDLFCGEPISTDNQFMHFIKLLYNVNTGMVSREAFVNYGFSESEIDAIFGGSFNTRIGISNPHRCVKDKVWQFMCFRELSRVAWLNGNKKLAKEIGMTMQSTYEREKNWLDWGTAIREFWQDELQKDYRSYVCVN